MTLAQQGDLTTDGDGASPPAAPPPGTARGGARAGRVIIWVAFALRLAVFPITENKQADAPMRTLLAERMNADPAAAADPRSFCQYGPLPIALIRPFLALDPDARRSSRVPSFLAGMAAFVPFLALAWRMTPVASAVALAGVALALSPLHIQLSTTASSEAVYLVVWLAMLDRLHAVLTTGRRRDVVLAAALGSLAAVTRYDSWLALPVAAAALVFFAPGSHRWRRALTNAALFLAIVAVLPAAYLLWSWLKTGDPFYFARFIAADHTNAAREVMARLGGALSRGRQLCIWAVSFAAAMTPVLLVAAVPAARRWRSWSPATRAVVVTTFFPLVVYLGRGLVFGQFEPLARFALIPGAVLMPLAAEAVLSWRWATAPHRAVAAVVAGALAFSGGALALSFGGAGRIWTGAESVSPFTRLDAEDRALARHLEEHRRRDEGVFIDTFGFSDITIAHAARVPATRTATLAQTRDLGPSLAETRQRSGASWFALHDQSMGRAVIPDWPADTRRFGHWRLAHVGTDGGRRAPH